MPQREMLPRRGTARPIQERSPARRENANETNIQTSLAQQKKKLPKVHGIKLRQTARFPAPKKK